MIYNELQNSINKIVSNFDSISGDRKEIINKLTNYINTKVDKNLDINLNFICTHNSRRSHLAQIWAQLAAEYYNINNVKTYSGGTEATAFYKSAVKAIEEFGFDVTKIKDQENPVYKISLSDKTSFEVFSKKFDDNINPKDNFCAIMTCSSADEACPFVPGCDLRIALTYNDPKEFDGTDIENEKYKERAFEIATEIFYAFSQVKTN